MLSFGGFMEDLELITNRDKTLRALQKIELEGLKEVDRICRKHNIKYSLGGGSCLGQVRHGGFIPWDDDIDIDMTAENYDKFIKVALKELDTNRFFLRCRQTDKKHLRSHSRLEIKFTKLGTNRWDKRHMNVGLFIDIMRLSYLPNNKFLRKIVSTLLFYIRCIENYKMFHVTAKKANHKITFLIVVLSKITPNKLLFFVEKKLTDCCGKKKTDWILDDAIINGNHGGFPSKGVDTYKDVYFEGIKIMNKKETDSFLKTLYSDKYMEWLPPTSRISHHQWTTIDFGVYTPKFDLPEDYEKYLTINYHPENLEKMQEVSFEMMDDIHKICKKNNIKYFVANRNAYTKLLGIDNYGKYFREPFKIAMPREDYEKFNKIAQKELGEKYFYQNSITDEKYKFPYSRVRLNYTYIRENRIPKVIEDEYNTGFYVSIIPLDNTSNNEKKRSKHVKKLRYLNHFIRIKWLHYNFRYFLKHNLKMKIKMILLLPFSLKTLNKKLTKEVNKFNNIKTDYYIDSSGYELDYKFIKKSILGDGKILKYLNHEYIFPQEKEKYIQFIDTIKDKKYKKIKILNYVKHNFSDSYDFMVNHITKREIQKIKKHYNCCFLTYYDIPDYQLSVLRYDEKKKKYLTNKEIINYEKN